MINQSIKSIDFVQNVRGHIADLGYAKYYVITPFLTMAIALQLEIASAVENLGVIVIS